MHRKRLEKNGVSDSYVLSNGKWMEGMEGIEHFHVRLRQAENEDEVGVS